MSTAPSAANTIKSVGAGALVLLTILIAVASLSGIKLPLISEFKPALFAILVLGMAACSFGGIGRVADAKAWSHPFSILGYVIGVFILAITSAALLDIPLPFIASQAAAMTGLVTLVLLKFILTLFHPSLIKKANS